MPDDPPRDTIEQYFRNIRARMPFTKGQFALDYSLQLQSGIANWARDRDARLESPSAPPVTPANPLGVSEDVKVAPVLR